MLYIISSLFNPERLDRVLKDILRFFPGEQIKVCYGVNKDTTIINNGYIKTDGFHFGTVTERDTKGRAVEPYHLGCVMSHINVLADAIENDYDEIIVCEDDLLLCSNVNRYMNSYFASKPKDWEMLRLSWHPMTATGDGIKQLTRVNNYRSEGHVRGCEMYMLNKEGIRKLYNTFKDNFIASVDATMEFVKTNDIIKTYVTNWSWGIQWNNGEFDKSDRSGTLTGVTKRQNGFGFTITNKQPNLSFNRSR